MKQKNLDAFEKCIQLMETGAPIEDCINKYPDLIPEMREILETTKAVMNLREEQIPADGMNSNRVKFLSQAKLLVSTDRSNAGAWLNRTSMRIRKVLFSLFSMRPLVSRLMIAILLAGVLIIFSSGLVMTSAKSLPGDSLYSLKRAVEDISVYLVPNREVRQDYEVNFSQQRVDEVKRLIDLGRIHQISFEGILESKGDTNWIVSGIPVTIQSETTIVGGIIDTGSFEPGLVVEVEGITNSHRAVTANEIHLREYQFVGLVQEINANFWRISGVQLGITSKTQIDDGIDIGDQVNVLIRSEDNGLYALAILHEIYPVITPIIQSSPTEKSIVLKDREPEIEEDQKLVGIVEKISDNYWVIGGQIVYIVGIPEITSDINIGDSIEVDYRTELNGSLTAISLEKITNDTQPGETEIHDTHETVEVREGQEVVIPRHSSTDEDKSTTTPENHETPEPPEKHEDNP
jgi:hypothetical protein